MPRAVRVQAHPLQQVDRWGVLLRFDKGTPAQWAAFARGLRASKNNGNGGVGRYDHSGFVHVDNRGYKADWTG
jgi:hypothetical protein